MLLPCRVSCILLFFLYFCALFSVLLFIVSRFDFFVLIFLSYFILFFSCLICFYFFLFNCWFDFFPILLFILICMGLSRLACVAYSPFYQDFHDSETRFLIFSFIFLLFHIFIIVNIIFIFFHSIPLPSLSFAFFTIAFLVFSNFTI